MTSNIFNFPNTQTADTHGLLGISESINAEMAFTAHCRGIFPWPQSENEILWWAPNPRAVLFCNAVHISRSLKKYFRNSSSLTLTLDHDFEAVIDCCARLHGKTWITHNIRQTYLDLYQQNRAHSCEIWQENQLIGGLYGVCIGNIFCGESMFSKKSNASKLVLVGLAHYLLEQNIKILDVQFLTQHLVTMGATEIARQQYESFLSDSPDDLSKLWQADITNNLLLAIAE